MEFEGIRKMTRESIFEFQVIDQMLKKWMRCLPNVIDCYFNFCKNTYVALQVTELVFLKVIFLEINRCLFDTKQEFVKQKISYRFDL